VDAVALVTALGGTATTSQLAALSRAEREDAVRSGRVLRLARGVYAVPSAPVALRAAAALRGVVSHTSAAQLHSLEVLHEPLLPHVTLPRDRSDVHVDGVVLHWARLSGDEVGAGVTTPLRTVVDCARTLPFAEALAVADSAVRRGTVTAPDLVDAARARRGAGRATVLRVADAADGRAANPFESALRAVVLDAGVNGFVPQLRLGARDFTARVDLGDPRRRIALEADSFAWHGDRAALARDCRRYDELVARGWVVLRFAWEHVVGDPAWVALVVRSACRRREHALRRRPARRPSTPKSA
jgi:very-short-patch-repair endonuclease